MKRLYIAVVGVAATAAPVAAQPVIFSAFIRGELGYGTNPFLRLGENSGAGFGSITVAPTLSYTGARSVTTLRGNYNRDQYFSRYGYTDSLGITFTRSDQLTEHLSSNVAASYVTTNKAILSDEPDPAEDDPLNIGQRSYRTAGNGGLQWQLTSADSVNVGASASRLTYGAGSSAFASAYTQYGVNGGYNHQLNARTSVGAQMSASFVDSGLYPRSRSLQPAVNAHRQLNAIWTADAHLGVIFQTVEGPFGSTSTSLGYGGSLCGAYPLTRICVSVDESSAPSGYGGLRKNLAVRASLSRNLTEHSRLSFAASYNDSRSNQRLVPAAVDTARALLATADYSRDISTRISAGFGGRYQMRDTSGSGTTHAISGTVNISAKLGRI